MGKYTHSKNISVDRYQNHIIDDPLIDNSGMYLMPKQRFLFSLE